MKRILSLLTAGLLLTFCLVSCANGASIAIYRIRLDNEIENLFRWNMELNSYRETVSYVNRDGSPRFSYQLYYERAEDLYSGYNLYEEIGDYKLYAYEGAVYADAGDGLCAVLLLGSTYLDEQKTETWSQNINRNLRLSVRRRFQNLGLTKWMK